MKGFFQILVFMGEKSCAPLLERATRARRVLCGLAFLGYNSTIMEEVAEKKGWFRSLERNKKELFILGMIDLGVLIVLIPFVAIDLLSLSMGWLLGAVLALIANLTMHKSSNLIFDSSKSSGILLAVVFFSLRFLLWIAGLAIAAICTFKPEWFNGFDLFNFWTTFAAYVPGTAITIIFSLAERKNSGGQK